MLIASAVSIIHIFTILSIGIAGITTLITVTDTDPLLHFHGDGVIRVMVGDIQVMVGVILITDMVGDVTMIHITAGEVVIIQDMEVDIIQAILQIQFTREVEMEIILTAREDQPVQMFPETMEEDQLPDFQQVIPEIKVPEMVQFLNQEVQHQAQVFAHQAEMVQILKLLQTMC